jgi:hypothetical protein
VNVHRGRVSFAILAIAPAFPDAPTLCCWPV